MTKLLRNWSEILGSSDGQHLRRIASWIGNLRWSDSRVVEFPCIWTAMHRQETATARFHGFGISSSPMTDMKRQDSMVLEFHLRDFQWWHRQQQLAGQKRRRTDALSYSRRNEFMLKNSMHRQKPTAKDSMVLEFHLHLWQIWNSKIPWFWNFVFTYDRYETARFHGFGISSSPSGISSSRLPVMSSSATASWSGTVKNGCPFIFPSKRIHAQKIPDARNRCFHRWQLKTAMEDSWISSSSFPDDSGERLASWSGTGKNGCPFIFPSKRIHAQKIPDARNRCFHRWQPKLRCWESERKTEHCHIPTTTNRFHPNGCYRSDVRSDCTSWNFRMVRIPRFMEFSSSCTAINWFGNLASLNSNRVSSSGNFIFMHSY